MIVSELIAKLQELPGNIEVGSWRYHFLPMRESDSAVSVETIDEDLETGERIKTEVAVLSFSL